MFFGREKKGDAQQEHFRTVAALPGLSMKDLSRRQSSSRGRGSTDQEMFLVALPFNGNSKRGPIEMLMYRFLLGGKKKREHFTKRVFYWNAVGD